MAYALHIERKQGLIGIEEWKLAVYELNGVRLSSPEQPITNLKTGEVITFDYGEATADVQSPKDGKWYTAFYWSNGSVSFIPKVKPSGSLDPVWQVATALATRLGAEIRGDQGETYDFETGSALKTVDTLTEAQSAPKEEIKFIFKYGTSIQTATQALSAFFHQHNIPTTDFTLNGKQLRSNSFLQEVKKTPLKGFDLVGKDFEFSFGSVARGHVDFLIVRFLSARKNSWDEWATQFISSENFVMGWIVNSEYDRWQNAADPLSYEAAGKSYSHLPMKSNDLPFPLEKKIIDVSTNPGRWVFRDGYVEAVGAIMWLGEPFWQLAGANRSAIERAKWLQVSHPAPSVIRVQAADKCYTTGNGTSGELQNQLRTLLFGNQS